MADPKPQQEPSMEEILASIRRIISEDGEPTSRDAEAGAAAPDDVLELTEIVEEEPAGEPEAGPVEEAVAPESEAEPEPEPQPELEAAAEPVEEAPAPPVDDALPRGDDEIELREEDQAPQPRPAMASTLLSDAAAVAAGGTLSSLVAAVDRAHAGTPIGHGDRTIEDLVKEVLRPMLKEWLDANLPHLVERIVEREVARLGRRAEGDD